MSHVRLTSIVAASLVALLTAAGCGAGSGTTGEAAPDPTGEGAVPPEVLEDAAVAVPDLATAPTDPGPVMVAFDAVAAEDPAVAASRDEVVATTTDRTAALVDSLTEAAPSSQTAAGVSLRQGPPAAFRAAAAAGGGDWSPGTVGATTVLLGQTFNQFVSGPVDSRPKSGREVKTVGDTTTTTAMSVLLPDEAGNSGLELSYDTVVAGAEGGRSALYRQGVAFAFSGRVCPDADGVAEFEVKTRVTGESAATGARSSRELTARVTARARDDAELSGADAELVWGTQERTADGRDVFVEASVPLPFIGSGGEAVPVTEDFLFPNVRRASQQASNADVRRLNEQGVGEAARFAAGAIAGAVAYWQQGKCVRIDAPFPATVAPASTTPAQVTVIHRIDGSQVPARVTVALAGPQSATPATVERAPGTVTYVAGPSGSTGTLSLTANSRRGRATLDVTVKAGGAYVASGGGPGVSISGEVADLTAPFTLQGTSGGVGVDFSYTPAPDGRSGAMRYSGSGAGFSFSGEGTYTVTGDEGGPLTLTQTASGCVDIGTCNTTTETVTLTPVGQ